MKLLSTNSIQKVVHLTWVLKPEWIFHHTQGWEAWPHAHLNEKLKSINIC